MSSHVPSAMIRQRNSGVFARVAAAGSHQQTRPAMAAKSSEGLSLICTLAESSFNPTNLTKYIANREPLLWQPGPHPVEGLHIIYLINGDASGITRRQTEAAEQLALLQQQSCLRRGTCENFRVKQHQWCEGSLLHLFWRDALPLSQAKELPVHR